MKTCGYITLAALSEQPRGDLLPLRNSACDLTKQVGFTPGWDCDNDIGPPFVLSTGAWVGIGFVRHDVMITLFQFAYKTVDWSG